MNDNEINSEVAAKSITDAHEMSDLAKLNPAEKAKMMKMLKKEHGEEADQFNTLESAVIKLLMGEILNLEELGLVMGMLSKRTGGKPMSKPAAKKEIDRIVGVVAKRAKMKMGKAVDLVGAQKAVKDMKKADAEKAKQRKADARELKKRTAAAVKDYEQTKRELKQARRDAGLPPQPIPSIYNQVGYGQKTSERGTYKTTKGDN